MKWSGTDATTDAVLTQNTCNWAPSKTTSTTREPGNTADQATARTVRDCATTRLRDFMPPENTLISVARVIGVLFKVADCLETVFIEVELKKRNPNLHLNF